MNEVKLWLSWASTYAHYRALRSCGNRLVALHVATTSRTATPDTVHNAFHEQLEKAVRKIEFKCHTLQKKYVSLGERIVHGAST